MADNQTSMKRPLEAAWLARWKFSWKRLRAIPVAFLGVGIYRAWLAIFFRYDALPNIDVFDYFVFEGAIGVVSLVLAFMALKITPLWSNKHALILTDLAMTGGAITLAVGSLVFESPVLVYAGLVCAGGGLAGLILMWAEFYGSLNPVRVTLYHALAMFSGECIKWLFLGMSAPYLLFFSIVLPSVSLFQMHASMKEASESDLPHPSRKPHQKPFPWKPILLMSTCTFAGGYSTVPAQHLLIGDVIGTLFVTAIIALGVLSVAKWFNFDTVYRLAFPLLTVGFLLVPATFGLSDQVRAFCYDAGYSMLSMFIMLIMSNLTYHYGVNAVWINGIERGARYIVEVCGWAASAFIWGSMSQMAAQVFILAITAAMAVVFIVVLRSERNLSASWGIKMESLDTTKQQERSLIVSELSKNNGLTPREEEVFQLVARGESMTKIADELFVSVNTVKAHINHIYRKFQIHSKDELLGLLQK